MSIRRNCGIVTRAMCGSATVAGLRTGLICVLSVGGRRKMKLSRDQNKKRIAKRIRRAKRRKVASKELKQANLLEAIIKRLMGRFGRRTGIV